MLAFGLGFLFEFLAYVRRRWAWALVMFFAFLGLLGLYDNWLERLRQNINAPNAGGMFGLFAKKQLQSWLGKPGATIIFATAYVVSLIFLTNFQLGEWVRGLMSGKKADANATDEEKALDRKARELEKQARKLQEQVDKGRGKKADAV